MSLALILLLLFFILGISLGPLVLAVAIAAFSGERGLQLARKSIGLGLKSIYRPAITFNTGNELALKKRSFDEQHDAQYISFGSLLNSVKRYLHDPQNRFHPFYGTPFGFVDELFGVVVDPRDPALGRELRRNQANGQYTQRVERNNRLHESVKAVFEMPRGHVGVRLPDVGTLVGGSFNSQVVDQIRDYYESSQAPRSSTTAFRQLLIPLAAFAGVVLLGMFAAGQGGGGGGGIPNPTGNSTTIETGIMLLLLSLGDRNRRNIGVTVLGVIVVGLIAAGLLLAFPMVTPVLGIPLPLGLWALIMLGLGMAIPPFVASFFGRSLGPIGMALGKLYIIIGLLGFDRPVINYDEGRYEVVEYANHDWATEPDWYRFAMTRIGISFANDERNWPDGTTLSQAKVEAMADGGTDQFRPAPTGYSATDLIQVGDITGFVPNDPDDESTFVRTDRTTGWFYEAGQDRRLMTAALQAAKQDFGGGNKPVGDKWILGASLVAMAMGALFDWVVFF